MSARSRAYRRTSPGTGNRIIRTLRVGNLIPRYRLNLQFARKTGYLRLRFSRQHPNPKASCQLAIEPPSRGPSSAISETQMAFPFGQLPTLREFLDAAIT